MTTSRPRLPYGSWPSPITAADAAAGSLRLEGAAFVGEEIWWGEAVPAEGGRMSVRRRRADGRIEDVLVAPWDARSRVHEYGGGAWTVDPTGRLHFVSKGDQRIWSALPGEEPRASTPEAPGTRYGGLTWQAGGLVAIRESDEGGRVPARAVVRVESDGVKVLADGSDFVAQPALSPDGSRIAWIAWDHPSMPWDRTELRVRSLDDDADAVVRIGTGSTSMLQPSWVDDDTLRYLDDRSGRWNIWQAAASGDAAPQAVAPADADTGGPLWVLGTRWYGVAASGRILAVRTHGSDEVVTVDLDGTVRPVAVPSRSRVAVEAVAGERALVSGSSDETTGIWTVDLVDGSVSLVRGGGVSTDITWLPRARAFTVDGPHGPVHAFDFAPRNPDVDPPTEEKPPYLVWVHGGPTAHVAGVADPKIAYFTSRGIGVLDVNYGGSTGYGRAYRERLRGQWGVVDVADVIAAARGLAASGQADPERLVIEGGSAGGWTVLSALVASDLFAAGVSRYGVGDARALAEDTHDFEARYLDGLIGPLPEAEALYRERSPLGRADRFRVPLLLLQGSEDAVVPPSQSEAIRDALAARDIPHLYVVYEGEGHGFRRTETVIHALETELAFLGQVLGFETPGVPAVDLD